MLLLERTPPSSDDLTGPQKASARRGTKVGSSSSSFSIKGSCRYSLLRLEHLCSQIREAMCGELEFFDALLSFVKNMGTIGQVGEGVPWSKLSVVPRSIAAVHR